MFLPVDSRGRSPRCLTMAFRAAELVNFYTHDSLHLTHLRDGLGELERRGIATDRDREALFRALIGHREFDEARRMLEKHPTLSVEAPVPSLADDLLASRRFSAIVPKDDASLQVVSLADKMSSPGTLVLAVSHPLCAFSKRAMLEIGQHPLLRGLSGRFLWLAPPEQRLWLRTLGEWNASHPSQRILLSTRSSNWPMVQDWSTPTFYLIKDGELVGQLSGWQDEGHTRALASFLDAD